MQETDSHYILRHGISAMKGGAGGGEGAEEARVTDKQSVIRMGLSCRTACPLGSPTANSLPSPETV